MIPTCKFSNHLQFSFSNTQPASAQCVLCGDLDCQNIGDLALLAQDQSTQFEACTIKDYFNILKTSIEIYIKECFLRNQTKTRVFLWLWLLFLPRWMWNGARCSHSWASFHKVSTSELRPVQDLTCKANQGLSIMGILLSILNKWEDPENIAYVNWPNL